MKPSALLLLTPLLSLSLSAFRPAAPYTERQVRELPACTAVSLNSRVRVVVRQGSPQRVEVEALPDDLPNLRTEVVNNRLRIYTEQTSTQLGPLKFNSRTATLGGSVTVYVTLPTVRGLAVRGSGRLQADTIQAQRLVLGVSGSGQLSVSQLRADTLRAVLSSSGGITAAGVCAYAWLGVSGSGCINTQTLAVQDCQARINSSGSCQVNVARTLDAHLSGSGSVLVSGHPQITSHASSSGRVRLR